MTTEPHSFGIMVLGTHRSGTSAFAHVLQVAGANLGERIVGASTGNEAGHWEDAFAVELHDKLLAGVGARWDDAFALPPRWNQSDAATAAKVAIKGYLVGNRSRNAVWAVKDPRLSQFGGLWLDAAASFSMPMRAVVMVRHPLEVAASLAARDGLGVGSGLLLWAEHTLSALRIAEQVPSIVIDYRKMLADWPGCARRINAMMANKLDFEANQARITTILDHGLRHQAYEGESGLPAKLLHIWRQVQALSTQPSIKAGTAEALCPAMTELAELLQPYAADMRNERRKLWERVGRAESLLSPVVDAARQIPAEMKEMRARLDQHQASIIAALSGEVKAMHDARIAAAEVAARAEHDVMTARSLAPQIEALRATVESAQASMVDAVTVDLRRMQESTEQALQSAKENAQRAGAEVARASEAERRAETEAAKVADLQRVLAAEAARSEDLLRHLSSRCEDIPRLQAALDAAEIERERLQRDLSVLRGEASRLGEASETLEQVVASRSWRLTRPLRVLARIMRGEWTTTDSNKARRAVLHAKARSPLLPVAYKHAMVAELRDSVDQQPVSSEIAACIALPFAQQNKDFPDIFVWAVIDWHFRTQRPQHLARALSAKGHRVFYVSNNFVDAPTPGFSMLPLDEEGKLFQIHLHLSGAPQIYFGMPDQWQLAMMQRSLAELLRWTGTLTSISIVQHPYWMDLATMVPSPRIVYDCMDHHPGFENNASEVLHAESCLIKTSDLVVVTSGALHEDIGARARSTALIRNASDFEFFRAPPAEVFQDPHGRRVIGYYGAIAEWFDVELVRSVATAHPKALVLLIGADTAGAEEMLSGLANVRFVGEVEYARLPFWLHAFDVCMLPFKVIPLTIATNPVKVYEYLCAGKPVVSVALPEMAQFRGLVDVANDHGAFVAAVGARLGQTQTQMQVDERQAFAMHQTWDQRADCLEESLQALQDARVSIVVLTYNNLAFTQACLESIEGHSDYRNIELIVVDNLSTDGSRDWLTHWADEPSVAGHTRKLMLNDRNAGFAAGNNVGLRAATGEYVVILNNDTYVTPGWVRTLCAHLRRDPSLGLVGPVTNNIGNEAKLDIHYQDMEQMLVLAGLHTRAHPGGEIAIATAAFFCVAMPRSVMEVVGDLDEAFGIGFFEDDDYCRRIEQAGFRIACAEDVFVHHHLSASFAKMHSDEKRELFERNKRTYEAKWGAWVPHVYRGANSG